jgi:hypothetical protein
MGCDFGEFILKMCSTPRGFDIINELIVRGETLHAIGNTMAVERITNGVTFSMNNFNFYAIQCIDVVNNLLEIVPKTEKLKSIDYVVLYEFKTTKDGKPTCGFDVIFMSPKNLDIQVLLDSECEKNTSWVQFGKIKYPKIWTQTSKFLPFFNLLL